MPPSEDLWTEVDRLVDEQKFQAASDLAQEILDAARRRGGEADVTRALIKLTQLRVALHGYETAVDFLRQQPWPEAPRRQLVLGLFYGQTLASYLRAYSWEIRQREPIAGDGGDDLATWTLDRLVLEIDRTYAQAYVGAHRLRRDGAQTIGELSAFIEPGDYPAHIRGTLLDAVTYLWIDLLADTGLWPADFSNELYRIELAELLGQNGADAPPPLDVEWLLERFPSEVNPIEKIAFLAGRLRQVHRAEGRPEAALEAHLELLRRLKASFSSHPDDRALLRSDLERALDDFDRSLPWTSMGLSLLAEMQREQTDEPMALAEARDTAERGARLHPESVGGQRCRHLVESLEAPHLGLASMAVDGAGRRSIEITHANLPAVHLRAWPVDLLATLRGPRPSWQPNSQDVERLLGQPPVAAWSKELPATPDLRRHRTFVTPPSLEPGAYVIAASMRRDFKGQANQRIAALFLRSDLVLTLVGLQSEAAWELVARGGAAGEPLDADVEVLRLDYRQGGARAIVEQRTGPDGVLRLDADDWSRRHQHLAVARVERPDGEHLALTQIYGGFYSGDPDERRDVLIYTDRSVYRPGQAVQLKVVAYAGVDGRFETLPGTALQVTLQDANGEQVAALDLETNDFGSASGQFTIPPGRLLGSWGLTTSLGGWSAVRVEEYKRPSFEVAIDEPTEALRLNRRATLEGRADYYFGLPVSAGTASWRVSREPYFAPWRWWIQPPSTPPRVIAHGESPIGQDGTFEITFTPEADERLDRETSYRYRVHAEVTDEGGETRGASRTVVVGFAAVEAVIVAQEPFGRAGEEITFTVERRRLAGPGVAGTGRYRVTRIETAGEAPLPAELPPGFAGGPPRPFASGEGGSDDRGEDPAAVVTAGDRLRPRWHTSVPPREVLRYLAERGGDGEPVASGRLEHGDDGEARLALELPGGAYRLHYTTEDAFGQSIERRHDFIVDGDAPLELPIVLLPRRSSVEAGDTLELLVHSGFEGQPMVLEIFHGERRIERREIVAGPAPQIVEVPVGEGERGGLGVTLTALRDFQLMRLEERIEVPWSDRRLEVAFESFRDRLRPGAEETFSVTVRGLGEGGEMDAAVDPATLELLAYMYDRSLELFAEHAPPRPLTLYPNRVFLPSLDTNLGQAPTLWMRHNLDRPPAYPRLRGASLRFYDGWPIGGPDRRGATLQRMERAMPMASMKSADASVTLAAAPQNEALATSVEPVAEEVESIADDASGGQAGEADGAVRSDFAETAFWFPHLRTDPDGAVRFEFTVPDSVTEWSVWAHALTRDLRAGHVEQSTRSVKDLLIRPYVPRFLRAGDRADLRLVISNAGDADVAGRAELRLDDPQTGADLLAEFGLAPGEVRDLAFAVPAGGTTTLVIPLAAPSSPRPVSVTARARAGDLADGERRPLPILPSRLHLAQSRFAALSGPTERILRFDDLADRDDPTREHEALVVSLDGQLFGTVLRALPYLVEYPYQCTEQTLNRYLSTGILSSLYGEHPQVAALAARLASERDTPLEPWSEPDANRRLLLEETPWLRHARGGENEEALLKVLDPEVAEKVRAKALAELAEIQTAGGAFPWWPGGPPSPYMTLYALQGFARGLEFGLDVPKEMTVSAWRYLEEYWRTELSRDLDEAPDCCAPRLVFFAWLLYAYPDASWTGDVFTEEDRRLILERAAAGWKTLSPRLKGYLALALARAGDGERAELVWDSVMDSAKTDEDLGTYWAPEDRAWLWYNDTVETHAFALRVLMTLEPDDPRRHGLAQWLLLDKKLNHWKSTRATAEAVYGLAAYMKAEGTLGAEQRASVRLGPVEESYVFEPEGDSRRQLVVPGDEVEPSMAEVAVDTPSRGFLFASATWHFATDRLPEEARGDFFHVERSFARRVLEGDGYRLEPLADGDAVEVGDQVEVRLRIRAKHAAEYVHLRDPRAAGFEPEDVTSGYSWSVGVGHYREIRDSGVNYFFEWLPAGEYDFRYRLRAATAGVFRVAPAELQSMYAPEFVAYSAGREAVIEGRSAVPAEAPSTNP